ncbi:glycosyltransferase family 4 protein [Polynucleobacter sp. Ross1-W9]|uniref:glycosyltransferase family 4 protein n=1 Tax=Polynucleobacter parvulilacunae TaxID=1855631 RepID=UPI001C0E64E4|nr:glycosyltransferase family 4 protein [Polynucleobacter parvulilacunae]MBU3557629.1 glycosyltransferase family 4 protein [Polynucleobacter parvulilacunae]
MKILVISDAQGMDGAQGSLRFATGYWKKQLGWEVDVFQPRGQSEQRDILIESGMNPIAEILPSTPYNVVLVNSFLNIDYLAKISNVPIVFWVHEADTVLWGSPLPVQAVKQLFARPQKIIFSTVYQPNIVFKSFTYQLPLERLSVIPYGIEPVEVHIKSKVDNGTLKVSWLGNVIARKRPTDLVNVVIGLSKEFPIQAEFIGSLGDSSSLGADFQNFTQASPDFISWSGAMPRSKALGSVASSDIYCHTSGDESFALAPLEAAAMGIPVILANLPVYQFVGWKHGENCLLYPVGDVSALAQCLRELRNNPGLRATLASRGKALADLYSGNLFLQRITQLMRTFESIQS